MKHFTEIKPDPFALENLIAWLEAQPRFKTYNYFNTRNCMLAQYFKAMGFKGVRVNPNGLYHGYTKTDEYPIEWDKIAKSGFQMFGRRTFGGALKRARVLEAAR
jgi:hypothetical protein